ncbi:MAG: hypothetical protein SFY92_11555 [Verrucomicrobiae bacterium]|nr:hypothetical protein [Verrucomicrobiae bacterium]
MKYKVKFSEVQKTGETAGDKAATSETQKIDPHDPADLPKDGTMTPSDLPKKHRMEPDVSPAAAPPPSPGVRDRLSLEDIRSSRSRGQGVLIALLLIVVVGLGGLVLYLFQDRGQAGVAKRAENFPIDAYFQNPSSLTGNHYSATLRVEAQLGYNKAIGRLMGFKDDDTRKVIPVLVPQTLGNFTFEKGQRYRINFRINESGVLYAEAMSKE